MRIGDDRQRDPLDGFEEALREWARSAPRTPPEEAAWRIHQRLRQPVLAGIPWRRWAVAASVLLAVASAWLWMASISSPPDLTGQQLASLPSLDDGTVLIWLDPETPLYLVLDPPSSQQGE